MRLLSHTISTNISTSNPKLKANSLNGTPNGARTTITIGLVSGIIENNLAMAPCGAFNATVWAITNPKTNGNVTGIINCCTSDS